MTHVNIATSMIVDAFKDKYEMATLISGDSGLAPPTKEINEYHKGKSVFLAFPPKRHNTSLSIIAKGSLMIGRKNSLMLSLI